LWRAGFTEGRGGFGNQQNPSMVAAAFWLVRGLKKIDLPAETLNLQFHRPQHIRIRQGTDWNNDGKAT